jgi:hypothetical protein
VLAAHGKLAAFRTYQKQPAHRTRSPTDQLRGFLNNWKVELAAPLVEALNPPAWRTRSTPCWLACEGALRAPIHRTPL